MPIPLHARRRALAHLLGASFALALGAAAHAQATTAPAGPPVTIVLPFAPGGGADMIARLLAERMTTRTGTTYLVENRAGANGIPGSSAVAHAAADGRTLLLAPTSHTINPGLYPKLPYDTVKDFRSVIYVGNSPGLVLVAINALPANSVKELVALAKNPSQRLSFGSGGNGNLLHLAGEYFNRETGSSILHIPYKGPGPVVQALLGGGEIQIAFLGPPQAAELLKTGKLKALAVTSPKRIPQLPDVPTVAESGYPSYAFDGGIQAAIYAPAGTPDAVIQRLNRDFDAVLAEPALRERLTGLALDVAGGPPQELDRQLKERMALYAGIIKAVGIKADQ